MRMSGEVAVFDTATKKVAGWSLMFWVVVVGSVAVATQHTGVRVFLAVITGLVVWLMVRTLRTRVEVDGDVVRVVNIYRSYTLSRSDLAELEVRKLAFNPGVTAYWRNVDGTGRYLAAIPFGNAPGGKTWRRGAVELAALREYLELRPDPQLVFDVGYEAPRRVRLLQWSIAVVAVAVVVVAGVAGVGVGPLAILMVIAGGGAILAIGTASRDRALRDQGGHAGDRSDE